MVHDRKVAVFLLAFATLVFGKAYLIPKAKLQQDLGAGAFPMFLAIVLGFLAIVLFLTAGRKKKSEAPKEASSVQSDVEDIKEPTIERVKRIFKALGVIIVYLALLPYLGFIVDTFIFGILYLVILYKYKLLRSILPSAIMSLLGYLIFQVALKIPLPAFMEAIR